MLRSTPVRANETKILKRVDEALDAIVHRRSTARDDVRRDLAEGMRLVVDAAFDQGPRDYAEDMARMNSDPVWAAEPRYQQSAAIRPKFFGGDPEAIVPNEYILHVSLNHRLLDNLAYPEYVALRDRTIHYETCAGFFRGPHYYPDFFDVRAKVIRAMLAAGDDRTELSAPELLDRTSLFIEYYPTWSRESVPPARKVTDVYCLALNDRTRRFILAIAPPGRVLITGNEASRVMNDYRIVEKSRPRAWRVYRAPKNPPATRAKRFVVGFNELQIGDSRVPVVRCGFLKSRSGINSDEDLRTLGRLLGGVAPDPTWPCRRSKD